MHALTRTIEHIDFAPPAGNREPRSGLTAVKPRLVGIDAIDLEAARGTLGFEGVLGHRFVATATEGPLEGKRVVAEPDLPCGTCERCARGLSAHCPHRVTMGLHGLDGALASTSFAPVRGLFEVPDAVTDEAAVSALLLARAHHVKDVVRLEAKTYITVLGDSPLALITAQVLARLNHTVRSVGTASASTLLCEKWAVARRPLEEVGRRADQDVIIDCSGTSEGLADALAMVRPRGAVLILEPAAPEAAEVNLRAAVASEISITGVRGYRMDKAVRDLAEQRIDTSGLVDKTVPLSFGISALRAAADHEGVSVAVEID